MKISWTSKSLGDLSRLHAFLEPIDRRAAARIAQQLAQAPRILLTQPQIGAPLREFAPREVRRLIVGDYELRYELVGEVGYILRLWHCREDR